MVVRLKHEWSGHPAGTIVKVSDDCANTMFQRDSAERMEPENNTAIKDRFQNMLAHRRGEISVNRELRGRRLLSKVAL
jgi:hypothetical protein